MLPHNYNYKKYQFREILKIAKNLHFLYFDISNDFSFQSIIKIGNSYHVLAHRVTLSAGDGPKED
jgi:hypothetical protein